MLRSCVKEDIVYTAYLCPTCRYIVDHELEVWETFSEGNLYERAVEIEAERSMTMFDFAERTKEMTPEQVLNYYCNLYYQEPQVTERGIVANAINDFLAELPHRVQKVYVEPPKLLGPPIPTDSEIAKAIFEDIEKILPKCRMGAVLGYNHFDLKRELRILKKKYTEPSEDKRFSTNYECKWVSEKKGGEQE